jgi:2-desacetyl-2-hydroxyethyl bacteriochlorophyllide A dehydrogenase
MKAAQYEGNRTFSITDSTPQAPGPDELRLNVAYVGICGTDTHIYHGAMDARVKPPQIIGHEMSGTVAEIGSNVTGFSIGDPVVVRPLDNRAETETDRGYSHICRNLKFIGIDSPGAFQNSWTLPAFAVHKAPAGVDLKLAALTEPLAVACHDVRRGEVKPGELAVVIGGGPIGILVAMVARAAGARVILSEVNEARLAFARELGFEAISPLETDLTALCLERSDNVGADIVFEVSGAKAAAATMTEVLAIRGRIVIVAIYPKPVEINLFQFFWKELKLSGARVYEPEDYEKALALIADGTLPIEKMITQTEPLERIQQAFESLDASSNAMKVLIDCQAR